MLNGVGELDVSQAFSARGLASVGSATSNVSGDSASTPKTWHSAFSADQSSSDGSWNFPDRDEGTFTGAIRSWSDKEEDRSVSERVHVFLHLLKLVSSFCLFLVPLRPSRLVFLCLRYHLQNLLRIEFQYFGCFRRLSSLLRPYCCSLFGSAPLPVSGVLLRFLQQ